MFRFFLKKRRDFLDPLAWYLSRQELHSLFDQHEVEPVIEALNRYRGRGHYASIRPLQIREELEALAQLVQDKNPRAIVEIGTNKGGTLFVWCRVARSLRKIVSVDLPGGRYGGGYHKRRTRLYREFVADKPAEMVLIRDNSQTPDTKKQVMAALGDTPLDFLFIDGDHRYEGVKQDFELYAPLVAPGGLIAFHDILPHRYHPECGVDRLWEEIKNAYQHFEYVQERQQGKMGIGVLIKPQEPQELCADA